MAYLPLSTANLPDPAIDPAQGSSPEDYFSTVLWTGDDVVGRSITGVGFQPDFSWIKCRNTARNNGFWDAVRGAGYFLSSNLTGAETDRTTAGLTSFISDGFTVGAGSEVNNTGETYVGWNWKANGSGVSNTDGSITSTVSANTESGFSIVSYTGNGTLGATIGHGLGVQPSMVMVKARNVVAGWYVEHKGLTGFGTRTIFLNETSAESAASSHWNNTAPTSSVFTVGNSGGVNQNTKDYIAYCFADVEGFSKFGSYEGTNNADGPFIYLGFRPKFFLLKNVDSALNWIIFDDERDPYNVVGKRIFPNLANAESAVPSNSAMDFLSNGVKIKVAGGYDINDTGTYIYMAFAENPFKYSNAR